MKQNTISVIVPVYNVEKYLDECIKSVTGSTYSNLELILVDDGSTDSSGWICDDWQKKDERIRVIHKENGGASSARNVGLSAATGDFIGFVDSDDMVSSHMYETLYNDIVENKAQMSICRYKSIYGDHVLLHNDTNNLYVWNNYEAIRELLGGKTISPSVCNKLYVRELFSKIRFDETVTHGEDWLINYYLMQNAKKITFRGKRLYQHRRRKGSQTTSLFSVKQFSRIEAAKKIKTDIEENLPQLRECGLNLLVKSMLVTYIRSMPHPEFQAERKKMRAELNEIWETDKSNLRPAIKAIFALWRVSPFIAYIALKAYKIGTLLAAFLTAKSCKDCLCDALNERHN